MANEAKQSGSTFLTSFVPGLILGLVVGGLAGAFLVPMVSESSPVFKGASSPSPADASKAPSRDERDETRTPAPTNEEKPAEQPPQQPAPAQPATTEPKPEEPKPETQPPK